MPLSTYNFESDIPAEGVDVFAWHERNLALMRLMPPWENAEILEKRGHMRDGDEIVMRIKMGPVWIRWKARHFDYMAGKQFCDVQVKGPMRYWKHLHSFRSWNESRMTLRESIQYVLPFGKLGDFFGYNKVRQRLNRLFTYRHNVTVNDLLHFKQTRQFERGKFLITGGNGFVGQQLAVFLNTQGHEVSILSRSGKSKVWGCEGIKWDPMKGELDLDKVEGIDHWIHLAGENVAGGVWTKKRIKKLKSSRVKSTMFLVECIKQLKKPPTSFVSASGASYYDNNGMVESDETSAKGKGILCDIAHEWEQASVELGEIGVRRVVLRIGLVLHPNAGSLSKMILPAKLGLGCRLGTGKQKMAWIAIDDLSRMIHLGAINPEMKGIYNAVSPSGMPQSEFNKTLARAFRRPTFIVMPKWILKLLSGKMAEEMLLVEMTAVPDRMLKMGFHFDYPELDLALVHYLGRY